MLACKFMGRDAGCSMDAGFGRTGAGTARRKTIRYRLFARYLMII